MRPGLWLVLAGTLHATAAAADGFVELAAGGMVQGGSEAWTALGGPSPKVALRLGTMDRRRADEVLSVDWTPIRTDAADTSAHRFRMLASFSFNARAGALNLSARTGLGFDFLRLGRASEHDTILGYAAEVGVGVWLAAGVVEVGGDVAVPLALHGSSTVGDLSLDGYLSIDVDVLLGVRHVWR